MGPRKHPKDADASKTAGLGDLLDEAECKPSRKPRRAAAGDELDLDGAWEKR